MYLNYYSSLTNVQAGVDNIFSFMKGYLHVLFGLRCHLLTVLLINVQRAENTHCS